MQALFIHRCSSIVQVFPIVKLAIPAIISNITVPLLGLIDMAIVGHFGGVEYMGAVAIGSMFFNCLYWLFGFLRMGTSGLTAQAYGRHEPSAQTAVLRQSIVVAIAISGVLLLLFVPIESLALWLMSPTAETAPLVKSYLRICVWGVPAVLLQYVLTGWFIGMQDTKRPMLVAISQNVCNIFASLTFVYLLGMKIEGVALGTLLSQWFALVLSLLLKARRPTDVRDYSTVSPRAPLKVGLRLFISLDSDLFFRTLLLMSVMFFFTSAGSRQGSEILAVNSLMMQTWLIFSYFMDGFAYAGEALAGKYYGACDWKNLRTTVRGLFLCGAVVAVVFTAGYLLFTNPLLKVLTDDPSVVAAAQPYLCWVSLIPLSGMAAFLWDGVFIGMTKARGMLWACLLANIIFFATYYNLFPLLGNHALWLSFLLFLLVRGITQTSQYFAWRSTES